MIHLRHYIRFTVLLAFAACAGSYVHRGGALADMDRCIPIDIGSNGGTIDARVGDELRLELEAISGTGYAWHIEPVDREIVELEAEGTKPLGQEEGGFAGGPVLQVFRLNTRGAGTAAIELNYYRVWEGKEKAIKTFRVTVRVVP